jgi:predicted esterase
MEYRLKRFGLPIEPPHLPQSFLRILERDDPGSVLRLTKEIPESLKRKDILVLSGKVDPLVPWSASDDFISLLEQQSENIEVKVYEGVAHEYTPEMGKDFSQWFLKFI